MVIYSGSCREFQDDVDTLQITETISRSYEQVFKRKVSPQEKRSWENSLSYMERAVRRSNAPDDCGILIEFNLPNTSRRIDFIITGEDAQQQKHLLIVELKQWERAEATKMDGVVETWFSHGKASVSHPSYQASGYRKFLCEFNEAIQTEGIRTKSCAYLHNYQEHDPEPLHDDVYRHYIEDSPIFLREDHHLLSRFITDHVGKGRGLDILYAVEHGTIRPSRKLIDAVGSLFTGNAFFTLIDEQKVLFELLKQRLCRSSKEVTVISGGPGTGKSVLSFNVLYALLKERRNAVLAAPNAAFREVMKSRLSQAGLKKKSRNLEDAFVLDAIITGSAGFLNVPDDSYDVIIVDEAHRLKDGTAYAYSGTSQVHDVIRAGKQVLLFADDNQMVRPEDIGSSQNIADAARSLGAKVHRHELQVQFRCSGMEGYINWLDHVLQIQDTGNFDGWDPSAFRFQVCGTPQEVHQQILARHGEGSYARMLAGYAWKWTSEREGNKHGEVCDVVIPEHGFALPWNSRSARSTWAIDDSGMQQVGCIHTSQGLEFDYVGVIIGRDLQFDPASMKFHASWEDCRDSNGKKGLRNDPDRMLKLIKNIYRTLMTRAMKGCYIYCCDEQLSRYFSSCLNGRRGFPVRAYHEGRDYGINAADSPGQPPVQGDSDL